MGYKDIFAESEKAGAVEDLKPNYFTFTKVGQEVIGRFKGKTQVISAQNNQPYFQYIFDTDDGLVKFPMGKSIDDEAGSLFQMDEVYRIEFKGKTKTQRGFNVNQFDIKHCIVPKAEVGGQDDIPFDEEKAE